MSAPPLIVPSRVRLDWPAASREEALAAAAQLLHDDVRAGSWEDFRRSIGARQIVEPGSGGVCLAHGRSEAVRHLALAAVRLAQPVAGENGPVRLVFVFAIPLAMAGEYLRAVGALARVCGDEARRAELAASAAPEHFARLLGEWIA